MKWTNIISAFLLVSMSSCFGEEEPVLPLQPQAGFVSTYRPLNGQVYYSLKSQKVVKENSVDDWDIAFSCGKNNYDILLNTSKGMGSFNTQSKEFDATYPEEDYPWIYDKCDGQENQSCLGDWGDFEFENPQSFGDVYLVSLGVDLSGLPSGIIKLRVNGYSEDTYSIQVGDLNGTYDHEYLIEKNDSFNFVYLSFEQEKVLTLEPPKNDWDLLFTSYTAPRIQGKLAPLSVPIANNHELIDGVLLNPYNRQIAIDTIGDFEQIDFFDVGSYSYSDSTNTIGKRWYAWYSERLTYGLTKENTFIIRDDDKNFYAIEFIQFRKLQTTRSETRFIFKSL